MVVIQLLFALSVLVVVDFNQASVHGRRFEGVEITRRNLLNNGLGYSPQMG